MESIIKHKKILIMICAVSSTIAALEIAFLFPSFNEVRVIEKWQFGLIATPFIIAVVSFFPLMYFQWFSDSKDGPIKLFLKSFYWLLVCAFIIVAVGIMSFVI